MDDLKFYHVTHLRNHKERIQKYQDFHISVSTTKSTEILAGNYVFFFCPLNNRAGTNEHSEYTQENK